jgi:ADP-heptose:LPS heptosyltransferase
MASRGATSDPNTWRNGLIIGHNHIGDVLYRTCSLEQLGAALPNCKWSYLVSPQTAELLLDNPAIADVLPWSRGENSWELEDGKFGDLRRREFDVVLCTNTLRHYPDLALAVALGIPNRVGYAYKGLSGLITRTSPIEFPSRYAEYFRRMVADVADIPPDWPLRPRVYPSEEDNSAAARAFTSFGFADGSPVVACSLTTRQAAGNWPRSHLLAALEAAHAERNFEVILTGAPSDSGELAAAARELSFPVNVLATKLSLRAFVALLSRCSALLTLDSGPRHMGNAAGIPVLFARNLSHSQIEAGKYCESETDLAPAVEYLSDDETKRVVAGIPPSRTGGALLHALSATASITARYPG